MSEWSITFPLWVSIVVGGAMFIAAYAFYWHAIQKNIEKTRKEHPESNYPFPDARSWVWYVILLAVIPLSDFVTHTITDRIIVAVCAAAVIGSFQLYFYFRERKK